ncbi:MAG: ribonuclease PH [Planctomycetes bacterium]|nr:ribonuclease PH [Planctomycetota bacterium]MCB9890889.1 ribonuclease PH [Planctomycetota bacterium]
MARPDGRTPDTLRPIRFEPGFLEMAGGSVLVEMGRTRVICSASVTDGVPPFLHGQRRGWLTAEYSMHPACSVQGRKPRDRNNRVDGRSIEIQRLIGRTLRSIVDFSKFPDQTVWIDCDVIQADGGTRTASINGAYVALYQAMTRLESQDKIKGWPIRSPLAAVSVGVVKKEVRLDLDYKEDSAAEVDLNLVMTSEDDFLEIQGTGERGPFSSAFLEEMLAVGKNGIKAILAAQERVVTSLVAP